MGLFSGGNSSSTTLVTNESTDRRVVADTGSVGVSGDHTVVNTLDQGAIAKSLDLARSAIDSNNKSVLDVLGLARQTVVGSVETLSKSTTATIDSLNTGYSNAKGLDAGKSAAIVAAVVVAGFVALYYFRKG